jgi:hypothetical protein
MTAQSEKRKEDWMNSKWRPMMGWSYMLTCIADFIIFPVLWSLLQAMDKGTVTIQWQPITLQGAGLYHIAMGAVLGLTAYGRTQEKLGGANNGGIALPSNIGTTYTPPAPVGQQSSSNFGAPVATTVAQTFRQPQSMGGGFNNGGSFGAPTTGTFTSRSGKPGPVQQDDPEL